MILLVVLGCMIWSAGIGQAASSGVVVTYDVASSTTLNTIGCPSFDATRTSINVSPGDSAVTTADCDVLFGSSNDTATLRAFQADNTGNAMSTDVATVSTPSATINRMRDISMANATTGWAVGAGTTVGTRMFKTVDGGLTWTAVSNANDGLDGRGEGVHAVSTTVAWANRTNSNEVARTTDGNVWTKIFMTGSATPDVNRVIAFDANIAWALGFENVAGVDYGRIWKTIDGGATWSQVWGSAVPNSDAMEGTVLSATSVFVATADPTASVLASSDGTNFASLNSPAVPFRDVDTYDGTHVTATGDVGTYVTANGGTTWTQATLPVAMPMYGVRYDASGVVVIAGTGGVIQRSTDHGVTWSVLNQRLDSARLHGVEIVGSNLILIPSSSSTILTSTDGGATWIVNAASTNANWSAVDGVDAGRLWRVGGRGTLDTSTDGGTTWSAQTSGTSEVLWDVHALSRTSALVVGTNGTILRTNNAGATWTPVASGTGQNLYSIAAAPDELTMFAAGANGTIIRSRDGGATWTTLASGMTSPIFSIEAWSRNEVIVGAAGGTPRLRTSTDGGATWTTRATPDMGVSSMSVVPGTGRAYVFNSNELWTTNDFGATWTSTFLTGASTIGGVDTANDGQTVWVTDSHSRMLRSLDGGVTWTFISSTPKTHAGRGLVAFSSYDAVAVQDSNYVKIPDDPIQVPDYDGAAASWGGTGFFGVCLRAAPGAGSTWPTTGSCTTTDGTNWRALPLHGGLASASVASRATPGTITASLRFGMKVPVAQPLGVYLAPVVFEVLAPG